jgi:hypothetical protein
MSKYMVATTPRPYLRGMATTDFQPARALVGGGISPVSFVRIQSADSGLYLQPDSDLPGAELTQQPEADHARQVWAFVEVEATSYRIFNAYSGLSLDARGTRLEQHVFRPDARHQRWVFDVNRHVFASLYNADAPDDWMVWDGSGASVQLSRNNGQSGQQWNLVS